MEDKINLYTQKKKIKGEKTIRSKIYPEQPLPHLHPDPQPQFPPQQDIFFFSGKVDETKRLIVMIITDFHWLPLFSILYDFRGVDNDLNL